MPPLRALRPPGAGLHSADGAALGPGGGAEGLPPGLSGARAAAERDLGDDHTVRCRAGALADRKHFPAAGGEVHRQL